MHDDESVDSDYDYDDFDFQGLGVELLAGELELAKVYGQEDPPAAEDELEWECRYFILYDKGKICHFDALEDGLPVGDRGIIELKRWPHLVPSHLCTLAVSALSSNPLAVPPSHARLRCTASPPQD